MILSSSTSVACIGTRLIGISLGKLDVTAGVGYLERIPYSVPADAKANGCLLHPCADWFSCTALRGIVSRASFTCIGVSLLRCLLPMHISRVEQNHKHFGHGLVARSETLEHVAGEFKLRLVRRICGLDW